MEYIQTEQCRTTLITVIPFMGFYNTIHDDNIDRALDSSFSDDTGQVNAGLVNHAFSGMRFQAVHEQYADYYVKQFATRMKICLAFESLKSPREYNFTTDRIFCTISIDEVTRLYRETSKTTLVERAAENFTSRSGFLSFYSPNVENWGELASWDHNQLGCLIESYLADVHDIDAEGAHEFEDQLMEPVLCNGDLDNWLFEHCDSMNRLSSIRDYLNQRRQREDRQSH